MKTKVIKICFICLSSIGILACSISLFYVQDEFWKEIISSVIVGLLINILSSVVIVVAIEDNQNKLLEKEQSKKQYVIYKRLQVSLNDFIDVILNAYKASTNDSFQFDENSVYNLFKNYEDLSAKINKINFNKRGYYSYLDSNNSLVDETWENIFLNSTNKFYSDIELIENSFFDIISGDIMASLYLVLNSKSKLKVYLSIRKSLADINSPIINKTGEELKDKKALLKFMDFTNILKEIYNLILYLDNFFKDKMFLLKNFKDYNRHDICPDFGSGL